LFEKDLRGVSSSLNHVSGINIGIAGETGCMVRGDAFVRVPRWWTIVIGDVGLVFRLVERMEPLAFCGKRSERGEVSV
jgi:hypothetical protein